MRHSSLWYLQKNDLQHSLLCATPAELQLISTVETTHFCQLFEFSKKCFYVCPILKTCSYENCVFNLFNMYVGKVVCTMTQIITEIRNKWHGWLSVFILHSTYVSQEKKEKKNSDSPGSLKRKPKEPIWCLAGIGLKVVKWHLASGALLESVKQPVQLFSGRTMLDLSITLECVAGCGCYVPFF